MMGTTLLQDNKIKSNNVEKKEIKNKMKRWNFSIIKTLV